MGFHSLRARLVLFLVALLGVVQITAFVLINAAALSAARAKIDDELSVGERVFALELRQSAERQLQAATVLASDFAFREAVTTGDVATLASALQNHGARIKAAALFLVDLDGRIVADSLPSSEHQSYDFSGLLAAARAAGDATSITMIADRALQLIAAPVRAPIPVGWIIVGFALNQSVTQELRALTGLNVSFALEVGPGWRLLASTLPTPLVGALQVHLPGYERALGLHELAMPGGVHQLRVVPIGGVAGQHVVAVLQRPIADAMAGFAALRMTLLWLGLVSLALSIAGSVLIALGITRPLRALLDAVRRIRQGDYSAPVDVHRRDEIGVLAQGLDHMRAGIAEREQRILRLAYEDVLTALPNRTQFADALERGIVQAREQAQRFAVLVMDLDRFKDINDTLGHGVGDHVLREVAARLHALIDRADVVARLGGDEFAVLVGCERAGLATEVAADIARGLEAPILYEGQPLDVGASIGIALFPEHGTDAEALVRNADIAMYVAKRTRSGYALYDPGYDSHQQEHLSLLGELRRAVELDELQLLYQPKVTLASACTSAAEALLRWQHPVRGMIPPALFIPFAEHTGYIRSLTRWVLAAAIRQCGDWRREGLDIHVSVNLSARDLVHRELPDLIGGLLAQYAVPAQRIGLEITESGFMEDPAHAQRVLERLSGMGLQLSIDDYGTGYSSLTYLMKLPVDELKIDRSFVGNLSGDDSLKTIVRSTIELGHSLGLKVVAEGVEDARAFALLRELNCDAAQGYYMSPPLAAEAFRAWLRGGSMPRDRRIAPPAPAADEDQVPLAAPLSRV
jgi:diguanylate cyclase (GGDEF)-like protein